MRIGQVVAEIGRSDFETRGIIEPQFPNKLVVVTSSMKANYPRLPIVSIVHSSSSDNAQNGSNWMWVDHLSQFAVWFGL